MEDVAKVLDISKITWSSRKLLTLRFENVILIYKLHKTAVSNFILVSEVESATAVISTCSNCSLKLPSVTTIRGAACNCTKLRSTQSPCIYYLYIKEDLDDTITLSPSYRSVGWFSSAHPPFSTTCWKHKHASL